MNKKINIIIHIIKKNNSKWFLLIEFNSTSTGDISTNQECI